MSRTPVPRSIVHDAAPPDPEGLPIGLQLIGNFNDAGRIIQTAHAFERANGMSNELPEI
jgi:Asp-tRNA(Asn)/Glu-tRNA(Gln) amidotransferase A subunit family amidase